jgi:hypothetical protein
VKVVKRLFFQDVPKPRVFLHELHSFTSFMSALGFSG